MLTLVDERTANVTLAANGGTATISTPYLRPRVEGLSTFVGKAYDAIYVDSAQVKFALRAEGGVSVLSVLESEISIERYPLTGGFTSSSFAADYPLPTFDTSGLLRLALGELEVDVSRDGICRVLLTLTNRDTVAHHLRGIVSVYGEPRPLVTRIEEGVFPVEEVAK